MAPSQSSSRALIMDLPVDIIREIFLKCISGPCRLPLNPSAAVEPRLVLSHVCSSWRSIALNMPDLWADICIIELQPTPDVDGLDPRLYIALSAWLSRSFSYPLSLEIVQPPWHTPDILNHDLISPNLHRCRRLKLGIPEAVIQELLLFPSGRLPALEDLTIDGRGEPRAVGDFINNQRIIAFQTCTKLRRVTFSSHVDSTNLLRLNLPWKQLSTLHFKYYDINPIYCLNILQECTSLNDCALIVAPIKPPDIIARSKHPLSLPSLHTLQLTFRSPHHHNVFLSALHLPSLRSFCSTGWGIKGFKWTSSTLKSFDRLETLRLGVTDGMTEDELYEFISPLRKLTMLELPTMGLSLQPSSAIFQGLKSGALVPRLTDCIRLYDL